MQQLDRQSGACLPIGFVLFCDDGTRQVVACACEQVCANHMDTCDHEGPVTTFSQCNMVQPQTGQMREIPRFRVFYSDNPVRTLRFLQV